MNIQAVKLDLIRKITLMENEEIIDAINHLLNHNDLENSGDWWDDLTKAQRESIQIARQQMAEGKGIPHDEVVAKYRAKYAQP